MIFNLKNIITAIGNINLNVELKKDKYFCVVSQDIQYQDGIFEILEQKIDIDFLILSQNIPGELDFIELIQKIIKVNPKINIYIILEERNVQIENELNNMKINKIFYSNQVDIKDMIDFLKNDSQSEEEHLKEEIEKLKELILKSNVSQNAQENYQITRMKNEETIKKQIKKSSKKVDSKEAEMICICGVYGSGKSIISLLIAKYYEKQNKKVMIIDADIYNNSIHTILGVKINNNDDKFIKINKNISIFSDFNDFVDIDKYLKVDRFNRFLNQIKNEYDIVIIDTTSNMENEYIKKILKLSSKIIFLVEPNLSEISKSRKLLDYFLQKINMNKEKLGIIFNKVYKNTIDDNILKNLFFNIKILGKVEYSEKYSECINKNKIKCLENIKLLKNCKLN